jgi:hypothetical protein
MHGFCYLVFLMSVSLTAKASLAPAQNSTPQQENPHKHHTNPLGVIGKLAKKAEKAVVTNVKNSVKAIKDDSKKFAADAKKSEQDIVHGHFKDAGKDILRAAKDGKNVVKRVPLVGGIVESGENAVKAGKSLDQDLHKLVFDAKREGLKKALKSDGKKTFSDAYKFVENTAMVASVPLMITGVGGAVGMAVGQSGFLLKTIHGGYNDLVGYKYKDDQGKEHTQGGLINQWRQDRANHVGWKKTLADAALNSASLASTIGSGVAMGMVGAGGLIEAQAMKNAFRGIEGGALKIEQGAMRETAEAALKVQRGGGAEAKAALDSAKASLSSGSLARYEQAEQNLIKVAQQGKNMEMAQNIAFGGSFGAKSAITAAQDTQEYQKDRKKAKVLQDELAKAQQSGNSELVDKIKYEIDQNNRQLKSMPVKIFGNLVQTAGNAFQKNMGAQTGLLMAGGAIDAAPDAYYAKKDYDQAIKDAQKVINDPTASAEDKKSALANQQLAQMNFKARMLDASSEAIGGVFSRNMAVTMGAQDVAQMLSKQSQAVDKQQNEIIKQLNSAPSSNNTSQ